MPESPQSTYTTRMQNAEVARDAANRRWSLLGNLRLGAALIVLVALWQSWAVREMPWMITAIVAAIAFVVLALQQRSARELRDRHEAMRAVNARSMTRLQHAWSDLPVPPDAHVDRTHPFAYDLNIVGEASLTQRIGSPVTTHGWKSLYASLLDEETVVDMESRQLAVIELADKLELRQRIEATVMDAIPASEPLEKWAAASSVLDRRSWLRGVGIIGPVVVIICAVIVALGLAPWPILLIPITFNTIVFMSAGREAASVVAAAGAMREAAASYRDIMAEISDDSPTSPLLSSLDRDLAGASSAMRHLATIVNFSIPSASMLYFPMQMLLMWDVNVLNRLENWRNHHGAHVPQWLAAMGEWEALAALSVLAHDHPEWTMPSIDPSNDGIRATALAHPLLVSEIAVANDVTIAPQGRFLFVTGSNMSGKSTLLRAIGVNVILAQAGAPVAAETLTMPPLQVSCCMRVEDSLAQGVSFFMAELRRLKAVVDRAQSPDGRTPLYLLDEILQGTNTAERQIASRYVLQQLTSLPSLGAVSSHDLELINDTSLEEVAIAVHFSEQFSREDDEPEMTFDYRLRPGLATSSNAIRLMEMIGFELPG